MGLRAGHRRRGGLCYGQVGDELLNALVSRKAFIYGLEIAAQILALVAFCHHLPTHWLTFIDNTAGQFALHKGYGKDTAVNGMLAAFWILAARRAWRPTFERVTSKANTADAVSRADLERANAEGWRRIHTPATIGERGYRRQVGARSAGRCRKRYPATCRVGCTGWPAEC